MVAVTGKSKALLITTADHDRELPATTELAALVGDLVADQAPEVEEIKIGRGVPAGVPGFEGYDGILAGGLSNGVLLGGFDLVIELTWPGEADTSGIRGIFPAVVASLGGAVDPARSMVAIGVATPIVEGTGPFQLVYCMRRVPEVSHDDFSEYWVNQHAKVAKLTPKIIGYYQTHIDPGLSQAGAAGAGMVTGDIDGVALESFATLDDFVECVRPDPSFARAARSSEEQVNDLSRAMAVLTQVESVHRSDNS